MSTQPFHIRALRARSRRTSGAWLMLATLVLAFLAESAAPLRLSRPDPALPSSAAPPGTSCSRPTGSAPASCCAAPAAPVEVRCTCTCCGPVCPMGADCKCDAPKTPLTPGRWFFAAAGCPGPPGDAADFVPLALRLLCLPPDDPASTPPALRGFDTADSAPAPRPLLAPPPSPPPEAKPIRLPAAA